MLSCGLSCSSVKKSLVLNPGFPLSGVSYLHLMFHTGPWTIKLSKYQWFVRQGLIDTSLTASVLNLLAVAVERHQTIFTMQLHSTMSTRRVFILMLGIWLVAIIMGLIPTMGWHCLCDLPNCSTMAPMYSRSYLVFWAILNLLTFTIMLAVYTRIFVYVRHKSKQMSQHTTQMRHRETVFSLMMTVSMILGEKAHTLLRHVSKPKTPSPDPVIYWAHTQLSMCLCHLNLFITAKWVFKQCHRGSRRGQWKWLGCCRKYLWGNCWFREKRPLCEQNLASEKRRK